ncbi:MAG: hypothetical protein HYY97_06635 [Rhodocyclales bacterium]|nr:hypothetical protein [Rhodocyclales bacterium]
MVKQAWVNASSVPAGEDHENQPLGEKPCLEPVANQRQDCGSRRQAAVPGRYLLSPMGDIALLPG